MKHRLAFFMKREMCCSEFEHSYQLAERKHVQEAIKGRM